MRIDLAYSPVRLGADPAAPLDPRAVELLVGPEAFGGGGPPRVVLTGPADPTAQAAGIAAAERLAAEVASEARAVVAKTDLAAGEREAQAALDKATDELARAKAKLSEATRAYSGALDAGKDPRPFRPAMELAKTSLEDTEKWAAGLRGRLDAAESATRAATASLTRTGAAKRLAELAVRRQRLRAKVETLLAEAAAELLAIDAAETALKKL